MTTEIQAVEETCTLETVKSNGFWWTSLPGNEVHHADGLACQQAPRVPTTSPCWMGAV